MLNKPDKRQSIGPQGNGTDQPGRRPGWSLLIWLVAAIILSVWFSGGLSLFGGAKIPISYTAFRQHLTAGNVQSVTIAGDRIEGTLKEAAQQPVPNGDPIKYTQFTTYVPSFGDDTLLPLLEDQGVEVTAQPASEFSLWGLLLAVLPFVLLIGLAYYYFRSMRSQGQGIFAMGRSRAKLYKRSDEATTFDDVAGARNVKYELQEIVAFLKDPESLQRLGGKAPKGVLLIGPPGTGKTLIARAVAGEADVPFFNITGSDFMEMFVGVGASRVRDMFQEAKKVAPCIIFIDELDSIGRRRGAGLGGGHDEREQTLNQLLSEMDGFEANESVIVMAATNRPDILDSALLRPGRFDRRVVVDLPTMKDRVGILRIHSRDKPLADDVDLEQLARGSPGFSGADLENLLNEAALLAARSGKDKVGLADIEEARDKILLGLKRESLVLTDEECRLLAYHEGGHAVVAAVLPHADPVHRVTIVPRGRAMGVTQQLPERDKYVYEREYMLDRLAVMMGGRAAEDLVLHTATSGAANDLKRATQLARKMVLEWGMSKLVGRVSLGGDDHAVFLGQDIAHQREYSEATAREVDEEVKSILDEAYACARHTLQEHHTALDKVAEALLEHEEIVGSVVQELVKEG